MPVRRAIANGNWSATSTWFGGALPTNGDTVAASGFTVNIDVDVTIGGDNNPSVNAGSFVIGQWYRITSVGTTNFNGIGASANAVGIVFQATGVGTGTGVATALATITTAAIAAAGAAAGGGFTINTARAFAADVRAGTTDCLTVTGTSNVTWLIQNIVGGSVANTRAIVNNATAGSITLALCTFSGGGTSNCHSFLNNSTGGLVANSCTLSGVNSSSAIFNASTGSVTANLCTITAQSGGIGITNNATGSLFLNSCSITAVSSSAIALNGSGPLTADSCTFNGSSSSFNVAALQSGQPATVTLTNSTYTAGSTSVAISLTNINFPTPATIQGSQFDSANGYAAVFATRYRIGTTPSQMQYRKALDGTSTTLTLYTADFSGFGQPATTDVRSGVSYASGSLTGTCAVPSAGSVALGVPVDNTTGTAVLTLQAVQQAVIPLV